MVFRPPWLECEFNGCGTLEHIVKGRRVSNRWLCKSLLMIESSLQPKNVPFKWFLLVLFYKCYCTFVSIFFLKVLQTTFSEVGFRDKPGQSSSFPDLWKY